ncbi:GTP pyrophosphokinase family protein (plasmid) [Lachnospiraceae bacterium C1.1]|nr:GTP pyrophosphokinase family protein [Lachnospiraceae bacterium C1.1]
MNENIYGEFRPALEFTLKDLESRINSYCTEESKKSGFDLVEHISARIKDEKSMIEKCSRRELEPTSYSALRSLTDAIGIRIVCGFIDDVYMNVKKIKEFEGCEVVMEKDYIKNVKPNGYRSYHMILSVEEPWTDVDGHFPGHFFAEIQLRTIAMDSWAALEHQLKYKKNISNTDIIVAELKRCADEMASTDISMQTIRDLINEQ